MLSLINAEAIQAKLLEIPILVQMYERRDTDFISAVKKWINQMDRILLGNRLLIGVDFALYRGHIISIERGLIPNELKFKGQPSARKIKLTVAFETLQEATKSVTEVLNPVIAQFAEGEKLARRIALMAQQKGLIDPATQMTLTREQIKTIWDVISKDPELRSSAFILKTAVGLRDALILFDRALVS